MRDNIHKLPEDVDGIPLQAGREDGVEGVDGLKKKKTRRRTNKCKKNKQTIIGCEKSGLVLQKNLF